jgi:flagellar motor switch protein FliG
LSLPASSALSGPQKAAVFCIQIGAEKSAQILKHLKDEEIERLTVEIAQARKVTPEISEDIFQEFIEMATAEQYIRTGGIDYARDLLERALGPQRAKEILQRLTASLRRRPFDAVRDIDPAQMAGFLQNEHPQTVAVILAHLAPQKAGQVMMAFPPERQADLVRRVSEIDRSSPELLREVEKVLEQKLSALAVQESTLPVGGLPWVFAAVPLALNERIS